MIEKTFDVYLRNEVPEHLSYSDSHRIPPIIALPKPGYYISDTLWTIRGMHGYDPFTVKEMTAVFLGYGPSFESCPDNPFAMHSDKLESHSKKCKWEKFSNTFVHSILCKLLFKDPQECISINSIYKS